ncbi:MAG TPA: choice-of-anchor D domain-containing protein [Anaeromyxobacteraceae bacterium]|nr:choice-of-anchor D domain-containing protein [Anaeromyxobacteraceae bacterium]
MPTNMLLRAALVAVAMLLSTTALGRSEFYGTNCSGCHSAWTTSTCNGCHKHGTHDSGGAINLTATANKSSYQPSETVSVTVNGGYRTGWVRAVLFDQNGTQIARSPRGASFPITISAPAPATPGTYTWQGAWYGNKFDESGATFGNWTADSGNANHGWEKVAVTVVVAGPAPQPKIALQPSSLPFGTVQVGTSATQTAAVQNTGNADLVVGSVTRCGGTSAEFSASPSASFTVVPGGSQTLTVRYTPADTSADSGCLQLASNDSTLAVAQLAVSGTGANPPSAVLDVDIGRFSAAPKRADISRSGTATPKASLVNPGTVGGAVTVSVEGVLTDAAGTTSPVYSATQSVTVAAGATAKVVFPTYTPTLPGTITWTATVADQDPDQDTATATTRVVP